ncbi:ATP-binding protein [uncultured Thiodictyon sp.]|uniref:ATP-binding protein n=1 Tax=uncultured Thiodictyon sp. TaxID=1846217 RepID=UPI0025E1FA9E|nr:ATP-binding protein [uncultured Thiodictyon sp.]
MTTSDTAAPLPDLSQCDAEPIHVPGSIQPHGVLLVLHGPRLRITQTSPTCQTWLGIAAAELLGCDLATVLGPVLADAVGQARERYRELPHAPSSFDWQPPLGGQTFVGYVHQSDPFTLLELEAAPADASDALTQAVLGFSAVHDEPVLLEKLKIAAALFRRLTGYDRVMIYRFDPDWHGEVVAEARRDDLEPYLGLHFPASDIPVQARRLYLINPTRVIVDVDYVPSPLVPALNPVTGLPLDLSRSLLRSVSPVHLEYLHNMGVQATLTTSLCREGRLWGLIACHHDRPRRVSHAIRQIADWLGQDLATQIGLKEEISRRHAATALEDCRGRIMTAMRQGARLASLLQGPEVADVLGAIGADGVALIAGAEITTGGVTPAPARIGDLVAGLSALHAEDPSHLFATECLSEHLAGTADLAATAAGVTLIPLDQARSIKLIWFRGEYVRTVTWGGNPDKPVQVAANVRLSPRQSFAAWTQNVRLRSKRWAPDELESVRKLGVLIEIEWRKIAEDALRASEALLSDVLDSLTAHLAVLDGRGGIALVNAAWRRSAEQNGGGAACLPGSDYLAVCERAAAGEDGAQAQAALHGIQQVLKGLQSAFTLQYPCDSPTEERWFEMRVLPLRESRAGVLIAHEDITAQKLSEQVLRDADQRKDEFLAMLGHELRNPLAPIRHVADVLTLHPMPEQLPWAASILTRQVSHLVRLVDDLLDVARINRGKLTLHRKRFDLREAVEHAIEQVRPVLDAHGQHLDVVLVPRPVTVDADPERLTQVVVNLLGNAAKFSAREMTVFLALDTADGEARIVVRDQGAGLAAPLLPQVFTAFTQGEQTLDRPRGGLGLGLALVKGLVELHAGRVHAASPGLGAGSTFTVQLPLAPGVPALVASHPERPIKGRVILVIDDDRDVAAACAMLLGCVGQQVHTAHDGLTGLEAAERLRPDLILLDIGLPDMLGYEVAHRLRATVAGRAARLVALTGYGQEGDRQRALEAGFDEHLRKPVDLKTLISVLGRCP